MKELKPQNYKDDRPAELFMRFHERARKRDPGWVYTLARIVLTPILLFGYRTKQIDVDKVPATGPVILAANHFSNMDHFLIGVWLRRRIRFLAKSQIFGHWYGDWIFRNGGVIPIRRGHEDEEAFKTLEATFQDRGGCVMIYVEGGRSRTGELGRPRPGVGRAALESGTSVVPIAIYGSQGVRRFKGLGFPKVYVRFGDPMPFPKERDPSRERQIEVAEEVFAEVRRLYADLERDYS